MRSAMKYYRCRNIWTPVTESTRICDTVTWFPHNLRMSTAARYQIIIVTASDLIKVLLTSYNNSLIPTLGTDTREHTVDLTNTFHQILPKKNDISFPSPTAPLSRVQSTTSSYSTAQVIPIITQKITTPSATPPRVIQQRVSTISITELDPTAKLPRVAAKHIFITPPLLEITAQMNIPLTLRRYLRLHHKNYHGQAMRTSTRNKSQD